MSHDDEHIPKSAYTERCRCRCFAPCYNPAHDYEKCSV